MAMTKASTGGDDLNKNTSPESIKEAKQVIKQSGENDLGAKQNAANTLVAMSQKYTSVNRETGETREVTGEEWAKDGRALREQGWSRPEQLHDVSEQEGDVRLHPSIAHQEVTDEMRKAAKADGKEAEVKPDF